MQQSSSRPWRSYSVFLRKYGGVETKYFEQLFKMNSGNSVAGNWELFLIK